MEYVWSDSKRFLGIPNPFTKYFLSKDRLFTRSGFISTEEKQVTLYHIRDLSVKVSLGQRIFGVGTISVISSDKSDPVTILKNIKKPYDVRDLIYKMNQDAIKERRVRSIENMEDFDIGEDEFSED